MTTDRVRVPFRFFPFVCALGVVAAATLLLASAPRLPPCPFRQWTGLACPGCGTTRAVRAAAEGRVLEAVRWNPLVAILLTTLLPGVLLEILAWVRKTPGVPRFRIGVRGAWFLAAAVIAYWVLRNLPWWPWPLP